MIDSLTQTSAISSLTSGGSTSGTSSSTGGFDAALTAAQKEEERKQAQQSDIDAIRDKGFSAWARDTQVEALKEKLRQKIMAEMGVDEQSLSSLSSVLRETIEKKIEEEVQKQMEEMTAKDPSQQTGQAAQQTAQAGKNDQDGKSYPVIAALAWPGAASVF